MNSKRYLLVIIAISFLFSGYIAYERFQVEREFDTYEITMKDSDIYDYAYRYDMTFEECLDFWKEAGVHSVNLDEYTISSLVSRGLYNLDIDYIGSDIVITGDTEGIDLIYTGLMNRLKSTDEIIRKSDNNLVIKAKNSDFITIKPDNINNFNRAPLTTGIRVSSVYENVGLGYLESDIEKIKNAGLLLRFKPVYMKDYHNQKNVIKSFFDYNDKYANQPYIFFSGNYVFGTESHLKETAKTFEDRNIALGLIETNIQRKNAEQEGVDELVKETNFKAVRGFSTWGYIRARYDYKIPFHHHGEEVMNAYFRAITERNINVIFFKPYADKNGYIDVSLDINKRNFDSLEKRLYRHNIKPINDQYDALNDELSMPEMHTSKCFHLIIAIGVIAAYILILNTFVRLSNKFNLILSIVLFAFTAILYSLGIKTDLLNKIFGFSAAFAFVTLSVLFVFIKLKQIYDNDNKDMSKAKVFISGIGILFIAIVISVVGAIFEISFYADSKYYLELDLFRGVKLSQILPIMFSFVISIYFFGKHMFKKKESSNSSTMKTFLNSKVKFWHVAVIGILFVGLILILARGSNTGDVKPPSFELLFRNLLENIFYARPRNKSIIIGFPSIMILIALVKNKKYVWSYPLLGFFVAVGQADIINSFSHLRTPLLMSFSRTLTAFILAIIVYIIYYIIYLLIKVIVHKILLSNNINSGGRHEAQ